jgi:hypothetical protein
MNFSLLGTDVEYSLNGEKIEHYRDFKSLIYPLNDPEASKLIRDSEDNDLAWWIFFSAGTVAGLDAALFYKPLPLLNVDFIDRISTGLTIAQFLWGPGMLFGSLAQSQKFNAVQRYNKLVEGEKETSWNVSPRLYVGAARVGLEVGCSF